MGVMAREFPKLVAISGAERERMLPDMIPDSGAERDVIPKGDDMATQFVMHWPYTDEPTLEKRIFYTAKRMHETYDDGPARIPALGYKEFAEEIKELFRRHGWKEPA